MIIIIALVILALFVILASNNDPCTTQITSCVYGALKNGVDGEGWGAVVTLLSIYFLYQFKRNK